MKHSRIAILCIATFASCSSGFAAQAGAGLGGQIDAIQAEKAARTPAQRKLASQLLFLSRERAGGLAVPGAPDLRSRVRSEPDGRVMVDISAAPNDELRQAILTAGGTLIYESPRWQSIRACLPPAALEGLAARADVKRIKQGPRPTTHTGPVLTEGDAAHKATASRALFGADGSGVKVGVISDSADHYLTSVANGELPAFSILPGRSGIPGSGEGTAMSELVTDVAPGAQVIFASASGGKAFFADSILMLRQAGCKVIVDDISYPHEWQFQDDEIGQAVNTVVDDGALYLSSSGNEGNLKRGNSTTWEGDFVNGGANALLPAGVVHDFGAHKFNRLTDDKSAGTLQWSDEYNTSANDYDLHILSADGSTVLSSADDTQDGDDEPFEFIDEINPGERIVIWKANAAPARYLRLSCTRNPLEIATAGQTIGHAATAKCMCIASSDATLAAPGSFTAASATEDASSDGPHKMFYHPDGSPITPGNLLSSGGVTIQSPALTAADGGATSVPGFEAFYGTSAAAPHAAAIAAVVWSRKPSLTNTQLRALLESSCIDIEGPGHEINSGNGILMADLALAQTRTPHEIWRQSNFGVVLAAGNSLPNADPDGDGVANVIEYATGSNPNAGGTAPLFSLSKSGSGFSLSYHRDPAASDALISFERSTQLNGWSPVSPSSDLLISTQSGIELRTAVLGSGSAANQFFRMQVTAP